MTNETTFITTKWVPCVGLFAMSGKLATVTDITDSGYPDRDLKIVTAEIENGHIATLYFHQDEQPAIGETVPVFFEMGGWNTDASRVYQNRRGYNDDG